MTDSARGWVAPNEARPIRNAPRAVLLNEYTDAQRALQALQLATRDPLRPPPPPPPAGIASRVRASGPIIRSSVSARGRKPLARAARRNPRPFLRRPQFRQRKNPVARLLLAIAKSSRGKINVAFPATRDLGQRLQKQPTRRTATNFAAEKHGKRDRERERERERERALRLPESWRLKLSAAARKPPILL